MNVHFWHTHIKKSNNLNGTALQNMCNSLYFCLHKMLIENWEFLVSLKQTFSVHIPTEHHIHMYDSFCSKILRWTNIIRSTNEWHNFLLLCFHSDSNWFIKLLLYLLYLSIFIIIHRTQKINFFNKCKKKENNGEKKGDKQRIECKKNIAHDRIWIDQI